MEPSVSTTEPLDPISTSRIILAATISAFVAVVLPLGILVAILIAIRGRKKTGLAKPEASECVKMVDKDHGYKVAEASGGGEDACELQKNATTEEKAAAAASGGGIGGGDAYKPEK